MAPLATAPGRILQLKNFMELAQVIQSRKGREEEVKLHLITANNEEYLPDMQNNLNQMASTLEPLGIYLSYEFSETAHDRSIILDNGWKIILGRGLDIFQKTNGWFDIAEYDQTRRQCKSCEITYLYGRN